MKTFRLLPFAVVMALAAISFSCSEDEDGEAPKPGATVDQMPTYADLGVEFPVAQRLGSDQFEMHYDADGRLTGGTFTALRTPFTVNSNPLAFTFNWSDGDVETYDNFRVNEAGYILSMDMDDGSGDEMSFDFTYNNDGRLTKMVWNISGPGYSGSTTSTLTWDGGRLMKWEDYDVDNYVEDGQNMTEAYGYTIEYSYGSERPNTGVYYIDYNDWGIELPLFYSGLLGRPAEYLPTSSRSMEFDIIDGEKVVYYDSDYMPITTTYDNGLVRNHDGWNYYYLSEGGGYNANPAASVQPGNDAVQRHKSPLARRAERLAARR